MAATTLPLFDATEWPPPPAPQRLFTALFPSAEACAAIDAERQRWPGLPARLRPVRERMHLTLQCFNAVDARHERDWWAALGALRFEPFEVVLTRAERWQAPSGAIGVLRPEPSEPLAALHQATARQAHQAGLPADLHAWRPHVTTLRRAAHCQPPATLPEPIRWMAREVVLIWSDRQAQPPRYHRLGAIPAR